MTWIEQTVSYVQTALIVLRVLGYISASWWVVLLPAIILLFVEMLFNAVRSEVEGGSDGRE